MSDELIKRLRMYKCGSRDSVTGQIDSEAAADLIEQQAARIAELEAQIAAVAPAVDAQPVADARWQPIETAPRGAKGYSWMMLAWGPEGDQTTGTGMRWGDRFFAAGVFHCLGAEKRYELREVEVHPTHWQPLPAAPAALSQKAGGE